MATCKTCKEDKPETSFYKEPRVKSGLRPHCIECLKIRNKSYTYTPVVQNTEAHKRAKQKWLDNNRDKRNAWNREYLARPEIKEKRRAWVRHNNKKRKARLRGAEGSHTLQEWIDLRNKYGNICIVPGCERTDLTEDHVIPISKGGTDYISNIQPMCGSHNSSKLAKEIDYR